MRICWSPAFISCSQNVSLTYSLGHLVCRLLSICNKLKFCLLAKNSIQFNSVLYLVHIRPVAHYTNNAKVKTLWIVAIYTVYIYLKQKLEEQNEPQHYEY